MIWRGCTERAVVRSMRQPLPPPPVCIRVLRVCMAPNLAHARCIPIDAAGRPLPVKRSTPSPQGAAGSPARRMRKKSVHSALIPKDDAAGEGRVAEKDGTLAAAAAAAPAPSTPSFAEVKVWMERPAGADADSAEAAGSDLEAQLRSEGASAVPANVVAEAELAQEAAAMAAADGGGANALGA